MSWHSFVERQTNYCTEHPAGSALSTAFFGFISGMRFWDLWIRQQPVPIGECVFVLVFVILAIAQAYFLARALRVLGPESSDADRWR